MSLTTCVCASLHNGTTAQLEDWLRLQRCSGVSRVALFDSRPHMDAERAWSLQPWIDGNFLTTTLTDKSAGAQASSDRRPPDDEHADQCKAVLMEQCHTMVLLEAPYEHLHGPLARLAPASAASLLPLIPFAAARDAAAELPHRPLAVRATLRGRSTPSTVRVAVSYTHLTLQTICSV